MNKSSIVFLSAVLTLSASACGKDSKDLGEGIYFEDGNAAVSATNDPTGDPKDSPIDSRWINGVVTCDNPSQRRETVGSIGLRIDDTSATQMFKLAADGNFYRVYFNYSFNGSTITVTPGARATVINKNNITLDTTISLPASAQVTYTISGNTLTLKSTSDWLCKGTPSTTVYTK